MCELNISPIEEHKLITQLVLSTCGISSDDIAACFSRSSLSNFCFSLSFVVLKTCWVLVLICSSILLASFVERTEVILCAVDSASLAFCISQILSLMNLMDASSATLRAPLVETGGRTCRSLGTTRFLMHSCRKPTNL